MVRSLKFAILRSMNALQILLDPRGMATVVGSGSAYFLQATQSPGTCKPDKPLTFRGVAVRSLRAGERFDLLQWSSSDGVSYTLSATSGTIHSTLPDGAVYTNK